MTYRPGMTVTGGYNDDGTFNPDAEMEISSRGSGLIDRQGSLQGWQDQFIEDSEGHVRHAAQDYIDPEDPSVSGFDWDSYLGDIDQVEGLSPALDAVAKVMPESMAAEWDQLLAKDNPTEGDLARFHQIKDQIFQLYQDADALAGTEEPAGSEEPDYEPPSEEEFNVAMETLYQQEADYEAVSPWREAAKSYLAAGDEVAAAVAEASAMFHEGDFSQETLINVLADKYDHNELARVYRMFAG